MAPRLKVSSPSFSRSEELRAELLAHFADVTFHPSESMLAGDALASFLADADGAIVGRERVDAAVLDACPRLRIVSKYGVGLDNLDTEACAARGIAVGWTAGVNRRSVAELALGFMLGLCHNVYRLSRDVRGGRWVRDSGRQLSGCTVGIVGFGHVGRELARLLAPHGCPVLADDIVDVSDAARDCGATLVDKETLFRTADVVTLHVPLTDLTHHLVNARTLGSFKRGAFLVNTSRGRVVDGQALKRALQDGTLAGAALDVFEEEPPTDAELLALPNLVGTPHIGGNAREAVLAMGRSAIEHVVRFFAPGG